MNASPISSDLGPKNVSPKSFALQLKWLGEPSDVPVYQSAEAAGMDVRAMIDAAVSLAPMERRLIPTGFAIAMPQGYECQVRPRSGLAFKHGVTVLNSPGTIDSDYRGEVKVLLVNLSNETFSIEPQMRIAQLVFAEVVSAEVEVVEALHDTVRGSGGFGSTGAS